MEVVAKAHEVLEKEAGLGNVWSLESLRRWLKEAGDDRPETVQKYVGYLPEHLVRRFIAKEGDAVLVTGRLPDVDSSRILPVVEKIDRALDGVRKQHPDFRISVTGLPAIAARNSARMISPAQRGPAAVRGVRRRAAGDCFPLRLRRPGQPAARASIRWSPRARSCGRWAAVWNSPRW